MVKPLGRQLKSLSVFAGATIMGDGKVVLILDVMGLALNVRNRRSGGKAARSQAGPPRNCPRKQAGENLLLFQLGDESRWAVELSNVTRLEEFDAAEIEREGARAGGPIPRAKSCPLMSAS